MLSRSLEARLVELTASRVRLVQAEEAERRRIERDLHDGVQAQLVAVAAKVDLARIQLAGRPDSEPLLLRAARVLEKAAPWPMPDISQASKGVA